MNNVTLTIQSIESLNLIRTKLIDQQALTLIEQNCLVELLGQLPSTKNLLAKKLRLQEPLQVSMWNMEKINILLKKWIELFENIPGYDYCPCCLPVSGKEDRNLLQNHVIMVAAFAPSMSYNLDDNNDGYEVLLKENGTASFWLPTLKDAEQYPELYNFKGTWKEAYLLLIETLKKGWPMDEFPDELKSFLKK